jgi:ABC-type transport system substrate-binding protein
MNSYFWRTSALIAALVTASACGGSSSPTAPSQPQSFLAGTWTGTVTIEREGEPTTSGPITWTFEVVPDTNRQTFRTTIRSQHAFLPITATATTAITPSNAPPARISTQGEYPSPRGCTGSLLSVGMAEATRIAADFSGVDCQSLAHSTFRGQVVLTKSGS